MLVCKNNDTKIKIKERKRYADLFTEWKKIRKLFGKGKKAMSMGGIKKRGREVRIKQGPRSRWKLKERAWKSLNWC